MKIQRFNEGIELESKKLMDKCLDLFKELWDDKLLLIKLNIVPTNARINNPTDYQLFCKINRDITSTSYEDFLELFNLLDKLKFEFKYGGERLDIFIDNIDKFINEMEIMINAKKYNL